MDSVASGIVCDSYFFNAETIIMMSSLLYLHRVKNVYFVEMLAALFAC